MMHNDGVGAGLSEVPVMQDVEAWGVRTIGNGLGKARLHHRREEDKGKDKNDKEDKKEGMVRQDPTVT